MVETRWFLKDSENFHPWLWVKILIVTKLNMLQILVKKQLKDVFDSSWVSELWNEHLRIGLPCLATTVRWHPLICTSPKVPKSEVFLKGGGGEVKKTSIL